jgi:hypothetical protein
MISRDNKGRNKNMEQSVMKVGRKSQKRKKSLEKIEQSCSIDLGSRTKTIIELGPILGLNLHN